ncbi:hypothetical protein TNCV_4231301 [Trichonephila clavipes]|uniref:Uncharacterized protein n=1 Tax=Trichonephila clavipes TaxID=2585209 RepID=A0A8X6SNM8_TRICX|nr:hypothetical protein TNCV_4231301 [Trichonephila clavipes]
MCTWDQNPGKGDKCGNLDFVVAVVFRCLSGKIQPFNCSFEKTGLENVTTTQHDENSQAKPSKIGFVRVVCMHLGHLSVAPDAFWNGKKRALEIIQYSFRKDPITDDVVGCYGLESQLLVIRLFERRIMREIIHFVSLRIFWMKQYKVGSGDSTFSWSQSYPTGSLDAHCPERGDG